jgi:hypothetical protein
MASQQAEFENRSHWFTETFLADKLRLGECLACSNLVHTERRSIQVLTGLERQFPHQRMCFEGGRNNVTREH